MVDEVDSSKPYLKQYPHPYQENVLPAASVHLCFISAQMDFFSTGTNLLDLTCNGTTVTSIG